MFFHLFYRCAHGFIDIRRFTVHLSVHIIAHLADDPDILQIHQRDMRFHDVQHIDNLSTFFNIHNIMLFPLYGLRIQSERADQCLQLFGSLR